MTQNQKMKLLGDIMQRCGALGDATLAGMLGELMSELSDSGSNSTSAKENSCKYVLCVEATLRNGVKVQHPIIGGNFQPKTAEDFKMTISSDIVSLQEQTDSMRRMIEGRFPVKVRLVPVTDSAIESLNNKLSNLIDNLMDMIQEAADAKQAAYNLMNVEISAEEITNEMLSEVMRKTIYAGACITSDGKVVDRTEERYVEEDNIDNSNSGSEDDEDEDEYDDDDYEDDEDEYDDDDCCDGNCSQCDGC